jgi:hypothetical protein
MISKLLKVLESQGYSWHIQLLLMFLEPKKSEIG